MTSSHKESTDSDQQSYFYVVWPEEGKSPQVCTSSSSSAVSLSTASTVPALSTDTASSSPAILSTSVPMSAAQPAFDYDREDSRHTSSSGSVQSGSPDQSPVQMLQQNLHLGSLQSKLSGQVEELPTISSNGVRVPQPISVSLSHAGGAVATTTTYMIPSISNAHVRHTKTVVLPSDHHPVHGNYAKELEADSNLKEIGTICFYC